MRKVLLLLIIVSIVIFYLYNFSTTIYVEINPISYERFEKSYYCFEEKGVDLYFNGFSYEKLGKAEIKSQRNDVGWKPTKDELKKQNERALKEIRKLIGE